MPLIDKANVVSQLQTTLSGATVATEDTTRLLALLKTAKNAGLYSANVETELLTRIGSVTTSNTVTEVALLAKAADLVHFDRQLSTANLTTLNAFSANVGTVVFVDSEGVPYVRKNNNTWSFVDATISTQLKNAWAWGRNNYGQLGTNNLTQYSSPVSVVGGFTDWIHISTARPTLAIRANGTLWGWGGSNVGDGTTSNRSSPVLVSGGFTDWVTATAGDANSGAIRANGRLYMWGSSGWGRNADGSGDFGINRTVPTEILGGFTDWVSLHHTVQSSVALRANGTIWGWGRNAAGDIGDGTNTSRLSPVSTVGGFTDWSFVGGGDEFSFGIRSNGVLYAWGVGDHGRLGDGTTTWRNSPVSVLGGFTDWVFATGGSYHSVGLRANGTAWGWGLNRAGSNGDGTSIAKSSPVSVVGGFTDWVSLGCAYNSTIGLRANGTLWAWGGNGNGELGTNNTSSRSSPVSVVGGFTDWVSISRCSVGRQRHFLALRGG